MKTRTFYLSLVLFDVILAGCANLEHINSFSQVTVKTLGCYNDIGYTYTLSYVNYTQQSKIYDFTPDVVNANQLPLPRPYVDTTEQRLSEEADKAITFYFASIACYFEGLAKLSDKDLVNYRFDDFGKSFKSNDKLKRELGIKNDDQIDAATKIAKVFADELMGAYRKRKISEVMINHNKDVAQSIETLRMIIERSLIPHLEADKSLVETKYRLILGNPKIEMLGKLQLMKDYLAEETTLDTQKAELKQLAEALEDIRDEHQKTVVELQTHKIDEKTIIGLVNEHAGSVYQLYTNIKTLSSKNNSYGRL